MPDAEQGPLASALPTLSTPSTFPFPYAEPYDIQLDLMRIVFSAIEQRKIAISPTGTGKSLTLLTSTLAWIAADKARVAKATEDDLRAKLAADDPDDPPWVVEHALRAQLTELRAREVERLARLETAREKEKRRAHTAARGKRARVDNGEPAGPAEDFLPEDPQVEQTYSSEVMALMAKYESTRPKLNTAEEDEEDIPKIYYTSRTHTQLRQLTTELRKTTFTAPPEPVSLVPLGSRRQLCINDKVRKLGEERLNDACLDMQKSGAKRCEYLPKDMVDARDAILATVRDIEDIVTLGKETSVCPYYATRKAVKQAHLVTLPYNLLLQKSAREALGIDLADQIVVIDEAHNLIDTLLSIYSCSLPATSLAQAASQLEKYLARFKSRLKGLHSLWIGQTLSVLHGLIKACDQFQTSKERSKMLNTTSLMASLGGASDQVNLMELVKYLRDSKLARKVSGYIESTEPNSRHAAIAAFHQVEGLLLALTDARDDGRVLFSLEPGVVLKYILLNPAERFREVVESARSVILAGGTMEPMSDFMQLFPGIPKDRFSTLSCSHVIPKSNLLAQVVSMGPRKVEMEFKFANRENDALVSSTRTIADELAELGAVIGSVIGLVPNGVVVFLPSYAFLDKVKLAWKGPVLERMAKKQIFYEPQTSAETEGVLRDYSSAASAKGALMFAVVGGKLSEGINFSDELGRCVIMVGLPFANMGSIELRERMQYVEARGGKDASRELYENLCMRAVNQSIGRAIRHANDYATILLVDKRYATARIRNKLPKWIGKDLQTPADYAGVAKGVAGFFRAKRAAQVI